MQHTLTKQPIQEHIDDFFDFIEPDRLAEDLMNVFLVSNENAICDKRGVARIKNELDTITAVISFVTELEQYKSFFSPTGEVHPLELSTANLKKTVLDFFKVYDPKVISVMFLESYVSSLIDTKKKPKEDKVSFSILFITKFLYQLNDYNGCNISSFRQTLN